MMNKQTASHRTYFFGIFLTLYLFCLLHPQAQESPLNSVAIDYYNKGIRLMEKKMYQVAITEFKEALKYYPEFSDAWNNVGIAYMHIKKYEEAIFAFKKALAHQPKNPPEIYLNLSFAYTLMGEQDQGLKMAQKVLTMDIKGDLKEKTLYQIASLYFRNKQYDKAAEFFTQILRQNPRNAIALFNMGIIYYAQGKFDDAINSYKKAIQINPEFAKNSSEVHFHIGNIYFKREKYKQAIQYYKKGYQLKRELYFIPLLAQAYEKNHQLKKSLDYLQLLVKEDSTTLKNYLLLADFYIRHDDLAKARDVYQDIVNHSPKFNLGEIEKSSRKTIGSLFHDHGQGLISQKMYQKAIDAFRMADTFQPSPTNTLAIADCQFVLQDFDAALESYLLVQSFWPEQPGIHLKIGLVYFRRSLFEDAQQSFLKTLSLDENNIEGLAGLAKLALKKQNFQAAITLYDRILDECERQQKQPQVSFYWNLALSLERLSKKEAALEVYLKLAEISKLGLHWFQVGRLYRDLGNLQEARFGFEKAMGYPWSRNNLSHAQSAPVFFYQFLGKTLFEINDLKSARKLYQTALNIYPDNYALLNDFAVITFQGGAYQEAQTLFSKALRIKSDGPEALLGSRIVNFHLKSTVQPHNQEQIIKTKQLPNPAYWMQWGHLQAGLKNYEAAYQAYEKFLLVKPNNDEALWYQTLCLANLKQWPEALLKIEMLANPPHLALQIMEMHQFLHTSLAHNYFRDGKLSAASAEYRLALNVSPASVLPLTNLGYIALKNTDLKAARAYFNQAYDGGAATALEVVNNKAIALVIQGESQQALSLLERHNQLTDLPSFYLNQGLIKMAVGQRDLNEIINLWQKYVQLNGPHKVRAQNLINDLQNFLQGSSAR
ncbi:tetratricopeptide repeat protein [candidate division CSSED10-310 bacterium]|uniref:Tetratricopeptide repeat protein n=1 Tax=candidate division CSSED10-310 bacterium TaxID=2855610 RepID=A0ABV6YYM8_UNCC1